MIRDLVQMMFVRSFPKIPHLILIHRQLLFLIDLNLIFVFASEMSKCDIPYYK